MWSPTFNKNNKSKKQQEKKKLLDPHLRSTNGTKVLTPDVIQYNTKRNNKQSRLSVVIKSNELDTVDFLNWYDDNIKQGRYDMSKKDSEYYNSIILGIDCKHVIIDIDNMINSKGEKLFCYRSQWVTEKQIKKQVEIQRRVDTNNLCKEGKLESTLMHSGATAVIKQIKDKVRRQDMYDTQYLFLSKTVPPQGSQLMVARPDDKVNEIIMESKGTSYVTDPCLFVKQRGVPEEVVWYTTAFSLTPLHLYACKVYQEEELWNKGIALDEYYAYAEVVLFSFMQHSYYQPLRKLNIGTQPVQLSVHAPLYDAFAFYAPVRLSNGTTLKFLPYRFTSGGNQDGWYYQYPAEQMKLQKAAIYDKEGRMIKEVGAYRPIVSLSYARRQNFGAYGILPVAKQVERKLISGKKESELDVLHIDHLHVQMPSPMMNRSIVSIQLKSENEFEISQLYENDDLTQLDNLDVVFGGYQFSYYWESEGHGLSVPVLELML